MYKKMEIQRKKALKKQRFALGDDNEEEMLTHKGETIDGTFPHSFSTDSTFQSLRNDYQDDDDEQDEELNKLNTELLMRNNLSNSKEDENPDRPKTQKEIMMEVVSIRLIYIDY